MIDGEAAQGARLSLRCDIADPNTTI